MLSPLCCMTLALCLGQAPPDYPIIYDAPEGTIIPQYRYVDGTGKVPFYGEYFAQSGDASSDRHDNPRAWHENLETISAYATCFDVILRYDDDEHIAAYAGLAIAAAEKGLLVGLHSYGTEGVARVVRLLERLEGLPDGQRIIRRIHAVKLADEPYLGGKEPEEMEELLALFAQEVKSRYPHIQSWINFAVSHDNIKTWGTGDDGRKRLPKGLDIVSIDVYAYLGNGEIEGWGDPDPAKAEQIALSWMEAIFRDKTYEWNQTRRMLEAIEAAYGPDERPMMLLLGCSGYVEGITHPTPPSILDRYFEIVRDTEWAGLIWWCYEDFKDSIGGRRPEIVEAHRRHGEAIREERLY